jgi:CRISPR-associated exonuclease Cas4
MYSEDDLLMLSALQHIAFCERQCALIHIEQVWKENRLTAQGRLMHERVHGQENETRGDIRSVRGLRLRSLELGIAGIADLVEFHRCTEGEAGIALSGAKGTWRVFPVEYKRGKPKKDRCDEIQLCAQAMCLEEMLTTKITSGALYYGAQHKRHDVEFDTSLREETKNAARRLHVLVESGMTPPAKYEKKCESCSMQDLCCPHLSEKNESVHEYVRRMTEDEETVKE